MMEHIKHDLRLSEVISPYGVGAVVDVLGESLIAADTSIWDRRHAPEISCQRLLDQIERRKGPGKLREPPTHSGVAGKKTFSLPYWRFPAWRYCERCMRMTKFTGRFKGKYENKCECGGKLVPMRYVAVCEKGSHIQDIPWFQWAHRGNDAGVTDAVRSCKAYTQLRFERSSDRGEGLASLRVVCGGCKRVRSLDHLVVKGALQRDGIKCTGRQPWQPEITGTEQCDEGLVAVQRGATGNYMAERLSALDIPEETPRSVEQAEKIRENLYFPGVVADAGGQGRVLAGLIADDLGVTVEDVLQVAGKKTSDASGESGAALLELKDGEWAAFLKKVERNGRDESRTDFVVDGWTVEPQGGVPDSLSTAISGLGQVRRIREVQALLGFRRHDPNAALVRADLGPTSGRLPIYPAIEVFGEGIFIRFDEEHLSRWENDPDVRARAEVLIRRREGQPWSHRLDVPEPRYIALHTLSHLLIRRLAFASGYSSASLRERIYANSDRADKTAGILIYTAAGDAQGTLGGLVRLGSPDKLVPLIIQALDDAEVCSNDPVCIESDKQRSAQLNLSACHGCSFISETSCETGNRLLDRQLILGGEQVHGLLEDVLPEIRRHPRRQVGDQGDRTGPVDGEWRAVLSSVDDNLSRLVQGLAAHGVTIPETGEEIAGVLTDLSWPAARLAVLLDGEAGDVEALEQEGWRLASPELDAVVSALAGE